MTFPAEFNWPLVMSPPHSTAVGSYGLDVQRWIEDELGITLRHWQKLALRRQYEHSEDGELCWPTVLESTPRRSGKSLRARCVALQRIGNPDFWGEPDQLVMHCGSDLSIAKEIHRKAWSWAESHGWRVFKSNGKEEVQSPDNGRWLVRSWDGVYGYDTHLGLADEAWKIPPACIDDGLEPSLMERVHPQLWLISTAHRKATSLMRKRMEAAMAALLAGRVDDVLLMWWGIRREDDMFDPATWRRGSPHWTPQRERMIASKIERAQAGEVEPDLDDPDPLEAIRSQYLNCWEFTKKKAQPGTPVVTGMEWAALNGAAPPPVPPTVVAVESWYAEGVCVASAWPVAGDHVVVKVTAHSTLAEAAADALGQGASVVLVGKTMFSEPVFADTSVPVEAIGSRMSASVTDLRRLIDSDVLRHDGTSDELAEQVLMQRTKPGPDGPTLTSRTRGDALKAAVWAVDRARQPQGAAQIW